MIEAVRNNMKKPAYDVVQRIERTEKIKPLLEKIDRITRLVVEVDSKKRWNPKNTLEFINSIRNQLESKLTLSEKQMKALNSVYRRYTAESKEAGNDNE